MNKMGMVWCIAGEELAELVQPTGEEPARDIINRIVAKTWLPITDIIAMMKFEARVPH